MMTVISSKNNDLIKYVRKISSRSRARREEGVFFAEGRRLISETPPEMLDKIFISEDFTPGDTQADRRLSELIESTQDKYELTENVFAEISDTKHSQGIAALVKCPVYEWSDLMHGVPLLLILENIQDPGNLGTMFRTAIGAGVSGVVMTKDCVDIFSPKVVRATMGAIYRMPFFIVNDASDVMDELSGKIRFYAAAPGGVKDYYDCDYTKPCAFMIGNEGNGLKDATIRACDEKMRIPMSGGLESLNAAMAAGILMYEARRQRDHGGNALI